jgi:hypothetical protein
MNKNLPTIAAAAYASQQKTGCMKKTIVALTLALSAVALGQTTTTPLAPVTLPTYVMFGASYNQFVGVNAFVEAIVPETAKAGGFYGSMTADLAAAKITINSKTGYALAPSFRAGEHKVLYDNGKNMLLIGGDLGAAFSAPSSGTLTGVTISVAGSFTVTYLRQLSPHFYVGIPVRMLYMSSAGPNGVGAWNPVVEGGLVWKP